MSSHTGEQISTSRGVDVLNSGHRTPDTRNSNIEMSSTGWIQSLLTYLETLISSLNMILQKKIQNSIYGNFFGNFFFRSYIL